MLGKKILKSNTKFLFHKDYKKFEQNKFANDLTHELQKIKNPSYSQFEEASATVLDNHVPIKKKQVRLYESLMTKALRNAIMTRSIYAQNFYDNYDTYKKQRISALNSFAKQNRITLIILI